MNPPATCGVSTATLREWATAARSLINAIEASGRPIPPDLQEPYAKVCADVEQVEAALSGEELGIFPLLLFAVPAIGALIYGGVVLTRIADTVTDSARQTVKAAGNAMSFGAYAMVGLMVFGFARRTLRAG